MANLIQHLAEVSTGYKVFEDNQVLTKAPLNGLVDYLDDQQRLTRVALLGVGIFCGLRVSVASDVVVLTKGVGVTTDGDLLRVPADLEYTRFRAYDDTAPKYDLFYDGNTMRTVFELLGEEVDTAATLDTFAADTGKKVADMAAVLLMESFLKDGDLCTGGDCDNKGKDALGNVRLLLIDPNDVGTLREKLPTLDLAARLLEPIFADRVRLGIDINTVQLMRDAYAGAVKKTLARLKPALGKVFPASAAILGDVFPKDPAPGWQVNLDAAVPDSAVQTQYDFLKDVVDTYNALGEVLAGDTAICCPPLDAFPKHLLLGVVAAGSLAGDANRTGFYPSPLVRASAETVDRARFLARRLDALITSFTHVNSLGAVTITPSQGEDRPLDDRAIPAYYNVDLTSPWPIHRAWSYERERRGMADLNYSANASQYRARPPANVPLQAQITPFSFMRVEGHIGKAVHVAIKTIEDAIRASNLPFTVRAVLIGADRPKILVKPPIRYNDLHRFHHLIRHDLNVHLDDVQVHSDRFKKDVDLAVAGNVFDDRAAGNDISVKGFADDTNKKVGTAAKEAMRKLALPYSQYKAEAWHADMRETVSQAANMRIRLGDIARTELVSPVDSLVANKHTLWAEWLDRLIQTKDDHEDDKLLFTNFIAEHPSAEHCGGASRGGTFVLVYVEGGVVVGDVTLPYHWPEAAEPEPEQPPLPPPQSRPPDVIDKGWRLLKPIPRQVQDHILTRLDDFRKIEVDPLRQSVDIQKTYVQVLRDSVDIVGRFNLKAPEGGVVGGLPSFEGILDTTFRAQTEDARSKVNRVKQVRQLLVSEPPDSAKRPQLEAQLKVADKELGNSIRELSKAMTVGGVDAKTDGAIAASIMTEGFANLTGVTAGGVAKTVRSQIGGANVSAEAKGVLGGMLKGSGLKA